MMKKELLIVSHLILTTLAYTSWLWLDWRIIAVLAVAHLILLEITRGCPLAHAQFPEDKDARFYEWWMKKLGMKFTKKNRRVIFIIMRYILPFILIGLAVLLQIIFNVKPLVVA
jgi:hypothetical protein